MISRVKRFFSGAQRDERAYIALMVVGLALLIVVRFTLLRSSTTLHVERQPDQRPSFSVSESSVSSIIALVLDSLIGTAIAASLIGMLIIAFRQSADQQVAACRVVESGDLKKTLKSAASDTREWYVKARTATYFSIITLSWLIKGARRKQLTTVVKVLLLDPRDGTIHDDYVRYRDSAGGGAAAVLAPADVSDEIYATLIRCAKAAIENNRLVFQVRFSKSLWIASLDISDSMVLVTGQETDHPGIEYSKESAFFHTYRDDFEAAFTGALLPMPDYRPGRKVDLSSIEEMRGILEQLNLGGLPDDQVLRVLSQLKRKKGRFSG